MQVPENVLPTRAQKRKGKGRIKAQKRSPSRARGACKEEDLAEEGGLVESQVADHGQNVDESVTLGGSQQCEEDEEVVGDIFEAPWAQALRPGSNTQSAMQEDEAPDDDDVNFGENSWFLPSSML